MEPLTPVLDQRGFMAILFLFFGSGLDIVMCCGAHVAEQEGGPSASVPPLPH